MCKHGEPLQQVKKILLRCRHEYTEIEKVNTAIQVNGRGFHSQFELETVKTVCELIWKYNKALAEYLKALKSNAALPIVPAEN